MDETIKALQDGNHSSFEQVFDMYYASLCRYSCSIINDKNDAEDIVQKVFCKLWDQHTQLEIKTSLKSYLYRIVHNESINFVHQRTSRAELNMVTVRWKDEHSNEVEHKIVASELQYAIDKAINTLAPQCKKVFELSRLEQLSYSEIASQLQLSVNTVENHISKALKQLRIELKDFLVLIFAIYFL